MRDVPDPIIVSSFDLDGIFCDRTKRLKALSLGNKQCPAPKRLPQERQGISRGKTILLASAGWLGCEVLRFCLLAEEKNRKTNGMDEVVVGKAMGVRGLLDRAHRVEEKHGTSLLHCVDVLPVALKR